MIGTQQVVIGTPANIHTYNGNREECNGCASKEIFGLIVRIAFDSVPNAFDSVPNAFDIVSNAFDSVPNAFDSVPNAFDSVPNTTY